MPKERTYTRKIKQNKCLSSCCLTALQKDLCFVHFSLIQYAYMLKIETTSQVHVIKIQCKYSILYMLKIQTQLSSFISLTFNFIHRMLLNGTYSYTFHNLYTLNKHYIHELFKRKLLIFFLFSQSVNTLLSVFFFFQNISKLPNKINDFYHDQPLNFLFFSHSPFSQQLQNLLFVHIKICIMHCISLYFIKFILLLYTFEHICAKKIFYVIISRKKGKKNLGDKIFKNERLGKLH